MSPRYRPTVSSLRFDGRPTFAKPLAARYRVYLYAKNNFDIRLSNDPIRVENRDSLSFLSRLKISFVFAKEFEGGKEKKKRKEKKKGKERKISTSTLLNLEL